MKIKFLILSICLAFNVSLLAQNNLLLGPEYNYYPAGHIIGIQLEKPIAQTVHSFNARLAANITKRKDFSGLNDNEEGWGFGGSLGYRFYPLKECSGIYLGLRADLWSMSIQWMDSSEAISSGETKILVVQPTFELGYLFHLGEHWELGTAFVNGIEINTISKGADVGEGWITLWQLRISRRIYL